MQDDELKKEGLRLGWINAEKKEHLKDNYGTQDISAYGFMEGYINGYKKAMADLELFIGNPQEREGERSLRNFQYFELVDGKLETKEKTQPPFSI